MVLLLARYDRLEGVRRTPYNPKDMDTFTLVVRLAHWLVIICYICYFALITQL